MSIEIALSRGKIALIDDEDFDIVDEFQWRAQQNQDGRWYAMAWNPYPIFVLMHRHIIGANKDEWVDHRNGDGLDNRKANLRICTPSENAASAGPTGVTSNFKGVYWEKSREKWHVKIMKNGHRHFIGRFDSEVEAAKAYDGAAFELFGEFAYLNFGN